MRIAPAVTLFLAAATACSQTTSRTAPAPVRPFQKTVLSTSFYSEGAAVADFDRDGDKDVASGHFWWEGPGFDKSNKYYRGRSYPIGMSSEHFFTFAHDVNADTWPDIVTIGFPGQFAYWYENPKAKGPLWKRHVIWPSVGMEAPAFADIDRDGQPELVCSTLGFLIYLKPNKAHPTLPWVPHLISKLPGWGIFTHGMGLGDVNGDGRMDLITGKGWFEQPKSLAGDPEWVPHPFRFGNGQGGAQMFAYDIDGDGDNDVLTSINGHAYGLSWFEHVKSGGKITFQEHVIQKPVPDKADEHQFSQAHAVAVADMNGDGLLDFVSGKRFWPHNGKDPGARDPVVLYWFELVRKGGVRFVPHRIDVGTGVGVEVHVEDLDGNGRPDIVVGNRKGVAVLRG